MVGLVHVPGELVRVEGLRRWELRFVLDTIWGLSSLDGVRGFGGAWVVREGSVSDGRFR